MPNAQPDGEGNGREEEWGESESESESEMLGCAEVSGRMCVRRSSSIQGNCVRGIDSNALGAAAAMLERAASCSNGSKLQSLRSDHSLLFNVRTRLGTAPPGVVTGLSASRMPRGEAGADDQ